MLRDATPPGDLDGVAYDFEHVGSGARFLHLDCDDDENLFSIVVSTPPPDDSGVAHVLEHMVLGSGSRDFPVRYPMREMIKRSLATFLKAQTHRDHTRFMVASAVAQDLLNVAEVFCDAVFHPLLSEESFRRDAYHVRPRQPGDFDSGLTVSGVVYNEVKGFMSSPERRLMLSATQALMPDTIYGRACAGTPEHLLDLTYEDTARFHDAHYHPGNACFIAYGNLPPERYLELLGPKLAPFERRSPVFSVDRQRRWSHPRRCEGVHPVGRDEPLAERTYGLVGWLVGDGRDPAELIALRLLDRILLGHEAAPLRRALLDSKLGADLISSGLGRAGPEATFHVGAKGLEPDRIDRFVDLVRETLSKIADGEIERSRVEAAFRHLEYDQLEVRPSFPVRVCERVLMRWPFDADPWAFLRLGEHLAACARRYEADPRLFNRLIRDRLLDNPHRVTVALRPDRDRPTADEQAAARYLSSLRAALEPEELRRQVELAERADRLSTAASPPEVVATLPRVTIADLPSAARYPDASVEELAGGVALLHNRTPGGIAYLQLHLDLAGLPAELWPYVPHFVTAFEKLGAAGQSDQEMALREEENTGGLFCGTYLRTHASQSDRFVLGLRMGVKVLDSQLEPGLAVLRDRLFDLDVRSPEELRDQIARARADHRSDLLHPGFGTALRRAARDQAPLPYLEALMSGPAQLQLCSRLSRRFDELGDDLIERIETIRDLLLNRNRLTVAFTGSTATHRTVRRTIERWIDRMRDAPLGETSLGFAPSARPVRVGLVGAIATSHCAHAIPAWHTSHRDEALAALAAQLVHLDYVLPEVRGRGRAYGAWCQYSSPKRVLALGAQNDPQPARTLGVFEGVRDYVRRATWSRSDIEAAIINTARSTSRPLRPGQLAAASLHQHLAGHTRQRGQERFERQRSASGEEVKRAALEMLDAAGSRGSMCVVGSRRTLDETNRQLAENPLVLEEPASADDDHDEEIA